MAMGWFSKGKSKGSSEERRFKIPEGLWIKCDGCKEIIYRKEVEKGGKVCPKCSYHFPISVEERIGLILDQGTFKEWEGHLSPADPLNFKDSKRYTDRIKIAQSKSNRKDAIVIGEGTLDGRPVVVGIFVYGFMGGSMGSVVGEKIARAAERAAATSIPLIIVTTSGGARMQEGILSLMQMAKTAAAVSQLGQSRAPFISILADPTFGGVTASFAMLGDVIIAEPRALIGFAGQRVIEQTIKQQLPEGFQRAEFLLDHGMIDMIVERKHLKPTLKKLLAFFGSGRP